MTDQPGRDTVRVRPVNAVDRKDGSVDSGRSLREGAGAARAAHAVIGITAAGSAEITGAARVALAGLCLSLAMAHGAARADVADSGASGGAQTPSVRAAEPDPTKAGATRHELAKVQAAEPEPAKAGAPGPAKAKVPAPELAKTGAAARDPTNAQAPAPGPAKVRAPDPAKAEASAPEADEGVERTGGLLSRIIEWFRSDDAVAAPAPAAEPAAAESDPDAEPATLGDVHAAVRDAIAEIELLRQATGAAAPLPRESDASREDLTPAHVHAMALEVLAKTARAQRRLGMITVEAGRAPVTDLAPDDLHRAIGGIVRELRRIKRQLVVETAIEPASIDGAATPPALHAELAHASRLLDHLVGRPPTLNDVRACVARIHDEMRAVASALDTVLRNDAPAAAPADRAPGEVAQQLLRAAYKAIGLQTALGMEASGVPAVALDETTPADALDAATVLLGEVLRIRAHLGVGPMPPAALPGQGGGPPADVYAEARLAVAHLDAMTRAAGDAR